MKNLFSNIKGDFFGGITSGIVALPLALAFGVSSGLGPNAGLYGAIFISFFAAIFGGTNTQISGPTAPMTAVSMVVISGIITSNNGDLSKALPAILTVFILAGLFQIILGIIRLGKYIRYIPYPVISGFMTAIGVIIILTQLIPSLGYYPKEDANFINQLKPKAKEVLIDKVLHAEKGSDVLTLNGFKDFSEKVDNISEEQIIEKSKSLAARATAGTIGALKTIPRALQNINWLEFALAFATIFIIYGFKKISTKIPSTLVALVLVTAVAFVLKLPYKTIETIPSVIPQIKWEIFSSFNISSITPYILTALTLALLGAIDSLLTSVVADNMTKTKHNPNKELIGQGIGNSIAALFGGIPGAGATIRTVVNINAGGKTKLSGMIAGVMLLIITLVLAPIASKIPAAVLAGVLITVGIGVMDYKGLRAIPNLPKDLKIGPLQFSSEVLIMLVVLLLSTFWDLVFAVGIGLIMASLVFMTKIGKLTGAKSHVKSLKDSIWRDEINFPENLKDSVFIKHIKGPLFFGSTDDFQELSLQIPETAKTVIIRLEKMQYIDQSGLYAMEDVLLNLKKKKINVVVTNMEKQPKYMMERIGIIPELIPQENIFNTFNECINWIKNNIQ